MNSNRQKRIIANAAKALKPGGYIAYMTCTFSREENEGVLEWVLKRFPLSPVKVLALEEHQSNLSEIPCYRLFPYSEIGAGGFAALLRRDDGEEKEFDISGFRVVREIGKPQFCKC